jgi:ubiquinone/menaquinone biosynthesis C-methylase UbiE
MASHASSQQGPSPAAILDTMLAFQKSGALKAAIEVELFRAVGEGPADASTLAKRCGTSERGTRILADYMVILGFLTKENGIYGHTPTSATFLDPRSPVCIGAMARFLTMPEMEGATEQLADIVRTGRTVLPGEGSVSPDNPIWVEFAHSMAPMMAPAAGALGQIVLRGRTGPMRVLDIAAGHGLFGIQIAKQNPQARIVGCDWAPVLEVAQQNADKAGVGDRYEKLAGSAFDVDFGGPYDAVLLTNFLHHFDVPTNVALLKKVRAALKPGGLAATLEFVPNDDRVSPPMAAGFSMTMLVSTASGDAYTYRQLQQMYLDAGFSEVEPPIGVGPHTVVIAK